MIEKVRRKDSANRDTQIVILSMLDSFSAKMIFGLQDLVDTEKKTELVELPVLPSEFSSKIRNYLK